MQFRCIESVRRLAADALAYGAHRTSLGLVEWDVGAQCDDPVTVEVVGRGFGQEAPTLIPAQWRS